MFYTCRNHNRSVSYLNLQWDVLVPIGFNLIVPAFAKSKKIITYLQFLMHDRLECLICTA